jgi:hypothetical protein
MKTKDWSQIPKVERKGTPKKYSSTQPPWVDPATFFERLPIVMQQVPPMPGEEALYKWIRSVLDAAAEDPEVMKPLRETAFAADAELVAPIMRWRVNGEPAGNGWTSPANNGAFGTDYIHRMGAVIPTTPSATKRCITTPTTTRTRSSLWASRLMLSLSRKGSFLR